MNKKATLMLLFLLFPMLLSGCSAASSQVENQAYALSLGVDLLQEEGRIRLSVQVPSLGGKSASSGGGEGSSEGGSTASDYLVSSATAGSFTEALDLLIATVPRNLVLSQLKTVVFSEQLARDECFSSIVREILLTYQLYSAADFIICRGSAQEFIEAQNPVIGTRLSNSMTAELEHYQSVGYSPVATLADIFYATESIYGDPVAIWAALSGSAEEESSSGQLGQAMPGSLDREGPNKNEYFGAALLHQGRMVGTLDGLQTRLLSILTGQMKVLSYSSGGTVIQLTRRGLISIRVDLSGSAPRIEVSLRFQANATDGYPDLRALEGELVDNFDRLTAYCQQLGVDPFDYARHAAGQFLTVDEWLDYGWHERFPSAQVSYQIEIFPE